MEATIGLMENKVETIIMVISWYIIVYYGIFSCEWCTYWSLVGNTQIQAFFFDYIPVFPTKNESYKVISLGRE